MDMNISDSSVLSGEMYSVLAIEAGMVHDGLSASRSRTLGYGKGSVVLNVYLVTV